jgi:choline dehydrogenase-like flavoprotein
MRGPLALFAVTPDATLGRIWQTTLPDGWSSWEDTGAAVRSAPSACQNADGRVEVFAAGEDDRLCHLWQESPLRGGWSGWERLGPAIEGDPVVARNATGHLEVYATGPGGRLGHMWQYGPNGAGGWSPWLDLGPEIQGQPAPAANADGRLEVFAIGPDGCLGHVWQLAPDGVTGWSRWGSFHHQLQSPPIVIRNAEGRLEVFAIGPDGRLGHVWQLAPNGRAGWSDWASFGHAIQSPPTVCANSDGRLEVFAIGPDGRLGHVWQLHEEGGGWSDWGSFGHAIHGQPVVHANAEGHLEVFAVGPNGSLGHVFQWESNGVRGWSDWGDLGAVLSEQRPAVCSSGLGFGHEIRAAMHSERLASRATTGPRGVLSADICVIGAGPAGITVAGDLVRAGAEVILVESGSLYEEADAQDLNHGDADGPIIKGHLRYLQLGRRRQVQGSAAGWGRGICMPLRAIDFERRPWVAHSGWPITPAELAPYEQRAAATFGFDPFNEPEPDGGLVRLSFRHPNDPMVFRTMFVRLLEQSGFRGELDATAVELMIDGDRVESVRLASWAGGELSVRADTVVLAAGGIENARLLLLNKDSFTTFPELTGRFFMEHPHVLAGTLTLPDAAALPSLLDGDRLERELFSLTDETQRREQLLNTSVQLRTTNGQPPGGPVECQLYVRAEQAPNPDSRVVLGERRDRFGCRQPYLQWLLLDEDWETVVRTARLVGSELEERHGATAELVISSEKPWPWNPAGPAESANATWGNHHLGTTRMADDPQEGVVDRNCLVHGASNLYIAGSSAFPTGGCANPTFEIVALAHRLADHLTRT